MKDKLVNILIKNSVIESYSFFKKGIMVYKLEITSISVVKYNKNNTFCFWILRFRMLFLERVYLSYIFISNTQFFSPNFSHQIWYWK